MKRRKHKENTRESGRKKLVLLVFVCCQLGSLLITLALLKKSARVSRFFVTKVARGIIGVMGRISGVFPFSLYETLLYLAGIGILVCLVMVIASLVRRRFVRAGRIAVSLVLAALVFGNVYFVAAGFSYHKTGEYYPTLEENLSKQEVILLADYFLDDLDVIASELERDEKGFVVMPYSMGVLSDKLRQEYRRLEGFDIARYTPPCKTITSSGLMSEMGVYGVFFAPFGEANINGAMPVYERPFTMAHEMAHAKGVMREDEANNLALYVTLTSGDPFIRYSALAERINTLLDAVWAWERVEGSEDFTEYLRLRDRISPLLRQDWQSNGEFNNKYNKLEKLSMTMGKINDLYLKIMGQKGGAAAYLPPDTVIIDVPIDNPDDGTTPNPGGGTIIIRQPKYNVVQRIFFQAYLESAEEEVGN